MVMSPARAEGWSDGWGTSVVLLQGRDDHLVEHGCRFAAAKRNSRQDRARPILAIELRCPAAEEMNTPLGDES
jgi:hypothetical protein